jgi:hypothetical protein
MLRHDRAAKNQRRKSTMRIALICAVCLLAVPALAQTTGGSMSGGMTSMGKSAHAMNASTHTMPASVTQVDAKTGLVDVNAAGMALKVHFPPASLANLKAGDKITLQLGFTKP